MEFAHMQGRPVDYGALEPHHRLSIEMVVCTVRLLRTDKYSAHYGG